jgi:hypothetical protein
MPFLFSMSVSHTYMLMHSHSRVNQKIDRLLKKTSGLVNFCN